MIIHAYLGTYNVKRLHDYSNRNYIDFLDNNDGDDV